jgi:hypothetical protein
LGQKEVEGKLAEFWYDKGWYSIVEVEGEERNVIYRSRNAQEAYMKWNVYIGRKKERPVQENRRRNEDGEGGGRRENRSRRDRGERNNNSRSERSEKGDRQQEPAEGRENRRRRPRDSRRDNRRQPKEKE